jgi:NitT/TauT family transport system substrate-binding protein
VPAGVHVGCFERFGTARVRSSRDLKGKTAAVTGLGGPEHVFLAGMAAYVGLDPRRDIRWVVQPQGEGTLDAVMVFPPFAQALRAQQSVHVVVNSGYDRPWSQYFCSEERPGCAPWCNG